MSMASMSPANLLTRIRLAAAGDTGRGLSGAEFDVWLRQQPLERKLDVFRRWEPLAEELREDDADAHAARRAAIAKAAGSARDYGKPVADIPEPGRDPILLAAVDQARAKLGVYGIGSREELHERVSAVSKSLTNDYRTHGEPEELKALRVEIAEVTQRQLWPATKALKDARDQCRVFGLALAEAAVREAAAKLASVESKLHELRGRLWSDWGLSPSRS